MKRLHKSLALILALISVLIICVAPAQAKKTVDVSTSVSVCGKFEGTLSMGSRELRTHLDMKAV